VHAVQRLYHPTPTRVVEPVLDQLVHDQAGVERALLGVVCHDARRCEQCGDPWCRERPVEGQVQPEPHLERQLVLHQRAVQHRRVIDGIERVQERTPARTGRVLAQACAHVPAPPARHRGL
jgi:hypothetical protein